MDSRWWAPVLRSGGGAESRRWVSSPAEASNARVKRNRGSEGADEKGAASVAEFAAHFGGAHGLPEPFLRERWRQVGESTV